MTPGYLFKLVCLCLACFFLLHAALALVVRAGTSAALRVALRMRAGAAARFLFLLRIAPAGFSGLMVAGLCAPSYLWLEPRAATEEQVGRLCLLLSILAAAVWLVSIRRGFSAAAHSASYIRRCEAAGRKTEVAGERLPAWVVEEPASLFAMGGIVRPRLFISSAVQKRLSEDQLAAALRHERAHWISRDNLKRLVLLLAPDVLPGLRGFRALERGWARFAERAADDQAAAGDTARSLALASALISVSRLATAQRPAPLMAPLLAGDDDLAERVERLLSGSPAAGQRRFSPFIYCSLIAALAAPLILIVRVFQAPTLLAVHRLLENLIR